MKKIIYLFTCALVLNSCIVSIPLQANLDNQTMLLVENRNIKVDYTLVSNLGDGNITYVSVLKNGYKTFENANYLYPSETSFKKMWSSYFLSKYNACSQDLLEVKITLKDLALWEKAATSQGWTFLTGTRQVNLDAVATIYATVTYHGNTYEQKFEVTASDYNESQRVQYGDYYYTVNLTNPTQQKSKLLEACLNKSIIHFENFVRTILLTHIENAKS